MIYTEEAAFTARRRREDSTFKSTMSFCGMLARILQSTCTWQVKILVGLSCKVPAHAPSKLILQSTCTWQGGREGWEIRGLS
jgi:hypothetical protein